MIEKLKQQLELLKAQLAADRKKAALFGILAVILLVVVGRLFFSSSSPNAIKASTAPLPASTATPVSVTPQVQVAPQQEKSAPAQASSPAALSPTPSPASGATPETGTETRSVSVAGMPRELARDLFSTPQWNKFMPSAAAVADTATGDGKGKASASFWGHLHRTMSEYGREQRDASKAFKHDLEQLTLQSTMTGVKPLAYISGRLVRPGDNISGFSVVRIADRQVIVARGGMTATLAMK